MSDIEARPGFRWSRVKWGAPSDPVSYECSVCDAAIGEDDVPLRLWTEAGWAAVFCDVCASEAFGITIMREPVDDFE